MIFTDFWRRCAVVSLALGAALLGMLLVHVTFGLLGLSAEWIITALDLAIIIAAGLWVIHIERIAAANSKFNKKAMAEIMDEIVEETNYELVQPAAREPELSYTVVQGDDDEVWKLDENGMTLL